MTDDLQQSTIENTFYVDFVPQRWGHYSRFCHFHSATYSFKRSAASAVRGVGGHVARAQALYKLSQTLVPLIAEEQKQGENKGVIPGVRTGEFAALAESIISNLYSAIDCLRKILHGVYPNRRGIPSDSTRRLFQNAQDGILDPRLPQGIRDAISSADWFPGFRSIRDGITHGETGTCHRDRKTGQISYFHVGLGDNTRAFVIQDMNAELQRHFDNVVKFLETVFGELNNTLKNDRVFHTCGMFRGRIYSRFVSLSEAIDFTSGICDAYKWFEKPENPDCPMRDRCTAYSLAKNTEPPAQPYR